QSGEVAGEIAPLMKGRIEREERYFVLILPKLRQHGVVGSTCHGDLRSDAHAAAHIGEDHQAERRLAVGPERENRSQLAVVTDLEIRGREAADHPSTGISDRGLDGYDVDRAAKR